MKDHYKIKSSTQQPKFLNLFFLAPRLPITAKVSILHRISGVLIILGLPLLIFIVNTIKHYDSYYLYITILHEIHILNILYKIILNILIWAFFHKMLAEIRHLLLDFQLGINKRCANLSAWLTILISLALTFYATYIIWF